MKINDKVIYNNKEWKIVAIKGDYAKIKLVGSKKAERIVELKDLRESE